MENQTPDTPTTDTTTETPQTTPPISAARLAANRANARRSTGPRTPQGKARSASNSFKHGLYSLTNFEEFCYDNNLCLAVVDNYLAEFEPITPVECSLVHQLIQFQIRFLLMEKILNTAMSGKELDFIKSPPAALPLILRELDRLPVKMQKCIKAIRDEQLRRDENTEIEPIDDLPRLPPHSEAMRVNNAIPARTKAVERIQSEIVFERFAKHIVQKFGHPEPAFTPDQITEEMRNEAKLAVDRFYPS